MALQELDSSNGALLPFYDPDTSVVYVCGKVSLGESQTWAEHKGRTWPSAEVLYSHRVIPASGTLRSQMNLPTSTS